MAYRPKRFSPLRRPQGETVDQLGQRLDRVQDVLKAQLDPMATALGEAGTSSGGSATLSDTPALALAASASAGTSDEASRSDHRHPLPAPLLPANGGTGLTALGTAYQVLRTNSAATAAEWTDPYAVVGINTTPSDQAGSATPIASFCGIQSFSNATTVTLNLNGNVDRLYAIPWVSPYTASITTIVWELTTGHAAQVVNWAIYESGDDGYPSDRIGAVSSLSLTTPALYRSAWASPVPVVRGRLYWIAWTTSSAVTAQVRARPIPTWSNMGWDSGLTSLNFGGGANPATSIRLTTAYAVPPATFPSTGFFPPSAFPMVGVYI